jgi:ABC-type multidrug transport system ATPase subunit
MIKVQNISKNYLKHQPGQFAGLGYKSTPSSPYEAKSPSGDLGVISEDLGVGISFEVKPGELFGFIGPDGAGKTTLFRIPHTLLVPDTGTATSTIGLVKITRISQIILVISGTVLALPGLTVEENLTFFASVFETTLRKIRIYKGFIRSD